MDAGRLAGALGVDAGLVPALFSDAGGVCSSCGSPS